MGLPIDLQHHLSSARDAMLRHPDHHLNWRRRRNLYRFLHSSYGQRGHEVHGWLAVLAAEKVLPIFTHTFPDDPLPQQLLHTARRIMEGTQSPKSPAMDALEDEGYLATGVDCMAWRSAIAYNAEYAGDAAYKALMETRGNHDLLERTEQFIQGEETQKIQIGESTEIDMITDEHIAMFAVYSDTASAAAVAFASDVHRFRLDRLKLRDFWEWWCTTGFAEAWTRVS